MSTPNPPKANPTPDPAKDGQSNKNAAKNGSQPAKTWSDPEEVQNDSVNTLETVIKAKLVGKPADAFDKLYDHTAKQVYPVIYKLVGNCDSIPKDYGHYNVLKRMFQGISGMQPKKFQEWCEQVELQVPFWDLDIPEHPSHHYQAWMLKEHPTEAPDFEKRYKPKKAATAPPKPEPAKASSSKTEPAKASSSKTEPAKASIPGQTQAAPRSPKGKEKAVSDLRFNDTRHELTTIQVAPKPESTTTTNVTKTNPAKIDSCDESSLPWVINVIKNSLKERQAQWEYGRLSNDLLAEGEGYFEVRLPHKLPTGQLHKDCFNNQAMAGMEGYVHPDFKILRFMRKGAWYLMPYRSIKKQEKKDSKEGHDARSCSKVTSEFVATYFALRGLRQGIVSTETSEYDPVKHLRYYFVRLAPHMAKALLDAEHEQIRSQQAHAEKERQLKLKQQRKHTQIEKLRNLAHSKCHASKNKVHLRLDYLNDLFEGFKRLSIEGSDKLLVTEKEAKEHIYYMCLNYDGDEDSSTARTAAQEFFWKKLDKSPPDAVPSPSGAVASSSTSTEAVPSSSTSTEAVPSSSTSTEKKKKTTKLTIRNPPVEFEPSAPQTLHSQASWPTMGIWVPATDSQATKNARMAQQLQELFIPPPSLDKDWEATW
ncbi:hypothetical protein N0V92_011234 [Colletotrichum tropicale]|nr:hypothetical protein N0V92_011234 [Colletotrichum tropicale]